MNRARIHTRGGVCRSFGPTILWVYVLALSGCATAPPSRCVTAIPGTSPAQHPNKTTASDSTPRQPLNDPGAIALVQDISAGMGARIFGADGVSRIGLMQVKNHSRATSAEFNLFRDRLVALLNRASSEALRGNLDFVSDGNQEMHYHVQGTAYLISAGGFDVWELFLSMKAADMSLSIWQAERPVRVLRIERPDQPQVVSW